MVGEVAAGLSALGSALNIIKGLKEIDDKVRLNSAVIDLQQLILDAQQAQQDLLKKNDQLEKQIAGFNAWEATVKRYQLKDYGDGTFAYELTQTVAHDSGEPIHRACPNCFQNKHLSILQFTGRDGFKRELVCCPNCKSIFALGVRQERDLGMA